MGGPVDSLPSVPGETGATSDHQPQDPGAIPVSSQTGDDPSMEQGSDCGSAATPSELGERDQGETKQAGPFPRVKGTEWTQTPLWELVSVTSSERNWNRGRHTQVSA